MFLKDRFERLGSEPKWSPETTIVLMLVLAVGLSVLYVQYIKIPRAEGLVKGLGRVCVLHW